MHRSIYVRPLGLFPARPQVEAGEVWGGLPLAGGALAFSALEVIERVGKGAERRVISLSDLFERDWGRHTLTASDLIENLRQPRGRLAGLSMDRTRIMGIVNVTPDSFSMAGGTTGSRRRLRMP